MKQILTATALALTLSTPLAAEVDKTKEVDEGFSLMEEGAKMLLRGLMGEMEPAIEELKGMGDEMSEAMSKFTSEMGPALAEMMKRIDDMRNYDTPEMLPNGDIIIRRSPDAPAYIPKDEPEVEVDPETGEITL